MVTTATGVSHHYTIGGLIFLAQTFPVVFRAAIIAPKIMLQRRHDSKVLH